MDSHPLDLPRDEHDPGRTVMWMETASITENYITMVGFFLLGVVVLATGWYGPPVTATRYKTYPLAKYPETIALHAAPISAYNRFVTFQVVITRSPDALTRPARLLFESITEVNGKRQSRSVRSAQYLTTAKSTPILTLYDDRYIHYDGADLVIFTKELITDGFESITGITTVGTYDHTTFQWYMRLIFSAVEIACLTYTVTGWSVKSFRTWSYEGKLITFLLILAVLSNNPLYLLTVYWPVRLSGFVDALATPAFHSLVFFTLLVGFTGISSDAVRLMSREFLGHVIVAGLLFLSEFLKMGLEFVLTLMDPPLTDSLIEIFLRYLEVVLHMVYIGYLSWVVVYSGLEAHRGSMAKFWLYFEQAIMLIFVCFAVIVIPSFEDRAKYKELMWLINFTVHNCFALFFAYVHWPVQWRQSCCIKKEENPEPEPMVGPEDQAKVVEDEDEE